MIYPNWTVQPSKSIYPAWLGNISSVVVRVVSQVPEFFRVVLTAVLKRTIILRKA